MKIILLIVNNSYAGATEMWHDASNTRFLECFERQPDYTMYNFLLYQIEDDEYDTFIDYVKMYDKSSDDQIVIVEGHKVFCKLGILIYMNYVEDNLKDQELLKFYLNSIYEEDGRYTEMGKAVATYFKIANYGFSGNDVFKRIKGLIIGRTSQPS